MIGLLADPCSCFQIVPKDRWWLHAKYFPLRYGDRPAAEYYIKSVGMPHTSLPYATGGHKGPGLLWLYTEDFLECFVRELYDMFMRCAFFRLRFLHKHFSFIQIHSNIFKKNVLYLFSIKSLKFLRVPFNHSAKSLP